MAMERSIIDVTDEVDELSAVLNTHDETGEVCADTVIRKAAVFSAIMYDKAKVLDKHRFHHEPEILDNARSAIESYLEDHYEGDALEIVKTAVMMFVTELTDKLIVAYKDQSLFVTFSSIREDLSLLFNIMGDPNGETENTEPAPGGVD